MAIFPPSLASYKSLVERTLTTRITAGVLVQASSNIAHESEENATRVEEANRKVSDVWQLFHRFLAELHAESVRLIDASNAESSESERLADLLDTRGRELSGVRSKMFKKKTELATLCRYRDVLQQIVTDSEPSSASSLLNLLDDKKAQCLEILRTLERSRSLKRTKLENPIFVAQKEEKSFLEKAVAEEESHVATLENLTNQVAVEVLADTKYDLYLALGEAYSACVPNASEEPILLRQVQAMELAWAAVVSEWKRLPIAEVIKAERFFRKEENRKEAAEAKRRIQMKFLMDERPKVTRGDRRVMGRSRVPS